MLTVQLSFCTHVYSTIDRLTVYTCTGYLHKYLHTSPPLTSIHCIQHALHIHTQWPPRQEPPHTRVSKYLQTISTGFIICAYERKQHFWW